MERTCLDCGTPLRGRVDKKFCTDQCRNNFNNQLNNDSSIYLRRVNSILKRNRRILKLLNPKDKSKVHRDKLSDKGFNFNYHTNTYTTQKGMTYYFCYEHGYLPLQDNYYALVRRREYIQ